MQIFMVGTIEVPPDTHLFFDSTFLKFGAESFPTCSTPLEWGGELILWITTRQGENVTNAKMYILRESDQKFKKNIFSL